MAKKLRSSSNGSYPPQVKTKDGTALLIGMSADGKSALVCYSIPDELRGKAVGPCRNIFIPASDIINEG